MNLTPELFVAIGSIITAPALLKFLADTARRRGDITAERGKQERDGLDRVAQAERRLREEAEIAKISLEQRNGNLYQELDRVRRQNAEYYAEICQLKAENISLKARRR